MKDELVTAADIERGLEKGVSHRILYSELNIVAKRSEKDGGLVGNAVRNGLRQLAEKIHESKTGSGKAVAE